MHEFLQFDRKGLDWIELIGYRTMHDFRVQVYFTQIQDEIQAILLIFSDYTL